jgi:hypothetical protein
LKNLSKLFFTIVLFSTLIIPSTIALANEDYSEANNNLTDIQKFSESVYDLPVALVQTSENTAWITDDRIVIVLLGTFDKLEEPIETLSSYISNNQLPERWTIEVVGGKNVSKETILQNHKANNDAYEKHGPIQLGGPPCPDYNENDVKKVHEYTR